MDKEKNIATVPFYVYEGMIVRAERYIKILLMAPFIALFALVLNNMIWMCYLNENRNHDVNPGSGEKDK